MQVQRHLQMRIEAQGKYLQSILEKAKETLAGHTSDSPSLEAAHAELTELVSKVTTVGQLLPANSEFSAIGVANNMVQPPDQTMMSHIQHHHHQQHQLPRQISRNSDFNSSHDKSYLTNLSPNAEDSGGVSGTGERQGAAPGTAEFKWSMGQYWTL